MKLHRETLTFMGHDLTKDGLKPSASKIEGIKNFATPTDKPAVQRLIGFANYLARFCPNISDVVFPLRELLKSENEFRWDERHTAAFDKLKEMLKTAPVLHYFDEKKEILIQTDSSKSGLGAILLQDNKVIEYASCALTPAEINFAQIEKKTLSILYALEKWNSYVYGRRIIIENDHRPLVSLFKKSLASAPKRLQRMMLRLQRFDFELRFKAGKDLILGDALSRAYDPKGTEQIFDEEIAFLASTDAEQMAEIQMIASPATLILIMEAANDPSYLRLKQPIIEGWPENTKHQPDDIRAYSTFADELAVSRGLVYKGSHLIVPAPVRSEVINRLHSSHIGVNGCLRRARKIVYWPGLCSELRAKVEKCAVCNQYRDALPREPLQSYPVPSRPWERISCDIFSFDQKEYLISVCHLSGYFEIDNLPSKAVTNIIFCL